MLIIPFAGEESDAYFGIRKKDALLDVLLKSTVNGVPLTDAEIREEVDTFMFEGHDTTSSAIGFTIYLLSKDSRVQEKLLKEINEKLSNGDNFNGSDLGKLKYMEMVIRESLRLFPPVPFLGRRIEEDLVLSKWISCL